MNPARFKFLLCNFLRRVSLNAVLFDVIPIITLPVSNTTGSFNTQEETIDQTIKDFIAQLFQQPFNFSTFLCILLKLLFTNLIPNTCIKNKTIPRPSRF